MPEITLEAPATPKSEPLQWKYKEGLCRAEQHKVVSHIYAYPADKHSDDIVGPLCVRGWNRSDGQAFSIFRGHTSDAGTCKVCLRRMNAGLGPVEPRPRKTKWI